MSAPRRSPRMTTEEIWAYVAEAHTGIHTTLRRDGMPIALPLWYVEIDRNIYFQTRGRKLQRIARDPRSSFLVEGGLRWAELKAVHFTGASTLIDDVELSKEFRARVGAKYAGFGGTEAEMPKETAAYYEKSLTGLVRFAPDERILHWDNAKLRPDAGS